MLASPLVFAEKLPKIPFTLYLPTNVELCHFASILRVSSIKYKVEPDKRYLPYIELDRWLCSQFQLKTPLNIHKTITLKLYNVEQLNLHH